MRRAVLLLTLAAASVAAAPRPPRAAIVRLSPDAATRWVPFELTPGNQVRFTLLLDGAPVSAILDTGVSVSVLSRRYAAAKGLPVTAAGTATVIGGSVPIGWASTRTVAFGGLSRRGGRMVVAELPAIVTGGPAPVDLLVGRDLLAAGALDLDYPNKRFRLLPTGQLPFPGATAPLAISPSQRVYVSRLSLGQASAREVIVDTGDGAAVTVSAAAWRAAALARLPTTTTLSYGLVGEVGSTVAIVPDLNLGSLTARNAEVRVEGANGFSERLGVAGRVGSGLLQFYRILLDPTAGRMVFQPGPNADKPPLRSTSGILAGLAGDRLQVLHVMRGGPADAAGWKAGELICTVDDRPIGPDYITGGLALWSIGAPGRVVRLGLCDGPTRELTLRHFY